MKYIDNTIQAILAELSCGDEYARVEISSIHSRCVSFLSGVPDYFGRNKISSGGDLSHYSSASLY